MLDTKIGDLYRRYIVAPCATMLVRFNIRSPNHITSLALLCGLLMLPLSISGHVYWAISLLWLSGFCDSLDGVLARELQQSSDWGCVYDIVSDRVVEIFAMLAILIVDIPARGLWVSLMLGSVLFCVTTFLVVGIFTDNSSHKGFHYSPGLMERAEAFCFFTSMLLFPNHFELLALIFILAVCWTGVLRMWQFRKMSQQ